MKRVQHVNRIKGLLFAQGIGNYEPLRSNRRTRLNQLVTGECRTLPRYFRCEVKRD